ncbi:unnamed protein product [Symbiodinium pilosum]|uniref:glucan endo-1,3-beta-D-glucosidase n=1 Tax=Symbiodinium pilosum TaxID=2952 RepID=A0A812LI39_SYMPI|nr:unnamed protein product [Symbiodinium pilosum]
MGNSSPRSPPELEFGSSEPALQDLLQECLKLKPQQKSALMGLLGTAIGDAVGLPFELHSRARNREQLAKQQRASSEPVATFWSDVMPFLSLGLSQAEGTPFYRSFSDDTVCTDLKMHAIAKVVWTCGIAKVPENRLFEALMQEYLAWAHGAGGQLFQGYGGHTKDLLKPTRGNRLGQLKIELYQPDSDYWPTDDFLRFAQEHCKGDYPGGVPSFGNGAVMSMTPQVLFQMAGAGRAAQILSCTHSEVSATVAADMLSELLSAVHQQKLRSSKDIGRFLLQSHAWKQGLKRLDQLPDKYVYPCAAFREFLESGDCKADTANSFLHTLITKGNVPPSESELVTHPGPFGYFGEMLRIAANFDDDAAQGRLVVEGRPDILVRFSQRGLNTTMMAIWCSVGARTCIDWLQRMLYLGGDTDTIGAVAGQVACPFLELHDVIDAYRQAVALDGMNGQTVAVTSAAARRFFYRSLLFVRASWSQLLQSPRLIDAKYDGLTTSDGMRLSGHRRTSCRFGGKCYDRKRQHRSQYSHPGDDDWQRLPCRYDIRCRDRGNAGHLLEFSHPGDHDWEALAVATNMSHALCVVLQGYRYGTDGSGGKISSDKRQEPNSERRPWMEVSEAVDRWVYPIWVKTHLDRDNFEHRFGEELSCSGHTTPLGVQMTQLVQEQFEKLARASSGRHAPPVSTSGGKEADWLVHIFGYEPLDPDVDRADQLLCLSPGQLPRLPMSLVPVEKKNGGRPPWTARGSAANGGRPPSTATGSSVIFSAFLGASCLLESWFCSAPNLPQEARETDVDIRPCNEDMAMEVLELDEEEFEQSRTKGIEVAVRFEEDLQATPERHHGEAPADSKTASSRKSQIQGWHLRLVQFDLSQRQEVQMLLLVDGLYPWESFGERSFIDGDVEVELYEGTLDSEHYEATHGKPVDVEEAHLEAAASGYADRTWWSLKSVEGSDSDDEEEITGSEQASMVMDSARRPATFFAETDVQRWRRLQGCELARDQDVLADGSTNVMQILDRRQQREREAAGGIRGVDIVDAEDAEFATMDGTVTRHEPNDKDSDSEDDGTTLHAVLGSDPDDRDKEQEEAQRKLDAASHGVMSWIRQTLRAWESQLTERASVEAGPWMSIAVLIANSCTSTIAVATSAFAHLHVLLAGLTLQNCPELIVTVCAELLARLKPVNTAMHGPKNTNKFWANWIVSDPTTGNGAMHAIYPMPYVLKLGSSNELQASHNVEPKVWYQDGMLKNRDGSRIELYQTPFVGEFALGASQTSGTSSSFEIAKEGLFGVHVNVKRPDGEVVMMYPIYSGMAYVSARYHAATPNVTTERTSFGNLRPFNNLLKIRDGIWSVTTGHHPTSTPAQLRLYALNANMDFVDSSFELRMGCQGRCLFMNKPLDGWMRVAHVLSSYDVDVLDAHAAAIVIGCDLQVKSGGLVRYRFESAKARSQPRLLHWAYAHHVKMLQEGIELAGLTASQAPTKGLMQGIIGDDWLLKAPLTDKMASLGFLPDTNLTDHRRRVLVNETRDALRWLNQPLHETNAADPPNWRHSMFKSDFYFSGKGFQKVGMVCLLAEELLTKQELETCAGWLATGFECMLNLSKGEPTSRSCVGAPVGLYYDLVWGGLPSRVGYNQPSHANPVLHCLLADFGNSCYNDHHYHFGYFVVSAAILVKLQPEWKRNPDFLDFVNGLIRDTSNPSADDPFFPRFRSFDWFDLHSWSRGLAPNPDGKDEESTSEELNLHYGIYLWGRETGNELLRELGSTMLALATATVQEFFLMGQNNPHHPEDYARNRAPGMLLQNKAHYATYFGSKFEYIHGIQMLPLSPALQVARTPAFAQLEWTEILCHLPLSAADPWTSVLLTGGLAMFDATGAFEMLAQMRQESMDDGLTRAWALFWASAQPQRHMPWTCGKPPLHSPRACSRGQYRDGVQCIPCPPGTWNDALNQTGFTACKQCEAGRFGSQAGLTSGNACTPCPPGTWSAAVGAQLSSVCIPCSRDPNAHPSCATRTQHMR